MVTSLYCGRFAPSPTGPLHFGSLVTALASYLEARVNKGNWVLRIDDLDRTRCVPGMDQQIFHTLEAFGFAWDGAPTYQSQNTDYYRAAFQKLVDSSLVYYCQCSRKQIAATSAKTGTDGPVYAGTCRNLYLSDGPGRAARIRVEDSPVSFVDKLFGPQSQNLAQGVGDFVIRRADGYFAYQLAVVVDDWLSGISQVVRGADLLSSTPRQIWLQGLLGYPRPGYLHIPLVRGSDGKKLSKSDAAHPVDLARPVSTLLEAWRYLKQPLPESHDLSLSEFWQWAIAAWSPDSINPECNDERTAHTL